MRAALVIQPKSRNAVQAWEFWLYISGRSAKSMLALANLEHLCRIYFPHGYSVRIIDLKTEPDEALRANVLATPTLKCVKPRPEKTLIGALTNAQLLLKGLGMTNLRAKDETKLCSDVLNVHEVGQEEKAGAMK